MTNSKDQNKINKLSFEDAIKELTGIVGKIEQGRIPLQESLQQYEHGMAVIKRCRDILASAEKRIEKISQGAPQTRKNAFRDPRQDQQAEAGEDEPLFES